uniref:mTERF domain-containing protein 1, mitochondrial n=1 Tax=Triticum urartu TaxID=4572 RepID=A0A8R7QPH5_TRIUA
MDDENGAHAHREIEVEPILTNHDTERPLQSIAAAAAAVPAAGYAMLRLRECVVSRLLFSPSTSPICSLRRLLSATASPHISPNPSSFAIEEYLVGTCGLTRPQALKASTKLSHLKSPTKPDAVLTFLAGLGLSGADVAAVVGKDPRLLCAKVDQTLALKVVGLTGLGLSRPDIARLVSLAPECLRSRNIVSKLRYYQPLFGSFHSFLRLLKRSSHLVSSDLDKLVKPNVAFLRDCGLGACDIANLCIAVPRMLTTNPERIGAMVACAERLGVPRGAGMLRQALQAVAFLSEEKIASKVEYLKNTFRWSDAQVRVAVCGAPFVLRKSKESLKRRSEFLFSEVGLEPVYVAHRPIILCLSLDGRVRPRYYVLKFLKENGLVDRELSFHTAVMMTEKVFVEKLICPHKEAAPHLAEDYAAACKGEVPTNFRFT